MNPFEKGLHPKSGRIRNADIRLSELKALALTQVNIFHPLLQKPHISSLYAEVGCFLLLTDPIKGHINAGRMSGRTFLSLRKTISLLSYLHGAFLLERKSPAKETILLQYITGNFGLKRLLFAVLEKSLQK